MKLLRRLFPRKGLAPIQSGQDMLRRLDPDVVEAVRSIEAIRADVLLVEELLDDVPGYSTLIPRTDVSLIVPSKDSSDQYARMTGELLTYEGSVPEFPMAVHFGAYHGQPVDAMGLPMGTRDGSHGSFFYLPDGALGRAEIYYWQDNNLWSVRYLMGGEAMYVAKIEHTPPVHHYTKPTVVYEARERTT